MKIGILTLPLHTNYGGIMQAYALQTVLTRMGHTAVIVNLPLPKVSFIERRTETFKRFIKKFILRRRISLNAWPSFYERKIISKYVDSFIQDNLVVINSTKEELLSLTFREKLDGYIVGSDQVWRSDYVPDISCFFLDFLEECNLIRVAYAASFGVDVWTFSKSESVKLGRLLRRFDAVSVREESAVALCKSKWGIDVERLLDPTLLLDKEDYMHLISNKNVILNNKESGILSYILDRSEEKSNIISYVQTFFSLPVKEVMAKSVYWNVGSEGLEDCIVPPITEWLAGFMKTDFVVTDSFHGVIFSIIFHKPFICIGNKSRGYTRFISLLELFDLKDRLVFSCNDLSKVSLDKPIDYAKIDLVCKSEINKSYAFLYKVIGNIDN